MRLLFVMDKKDYGDCTRRFTRNSARSIIIRDRKVMMIFSRKYGYYKFPGGGIEAGESPVQAMIRETREETGLVVIPETIREYGLVHRIHRSDIDPAECFVQDNFYFLCDTREERVPLELDDYEAREAYQLRLVSPREAIRINRSVKNSPYNPLMLQREVRVLEMLMEEGIIG
ncbi:MAG: NUDIX domain-containing protein [Lachnospiraceae bacterium]|nr:NUDIX domain-containing protein [Lachnospiraceae bacterium]